MYPLIAFLALLCVGAPHAAFAHAFGANYALPLPTSLYIWGGAAAVAFSFIVLALSPRRFRGAGVGGALVLSPRHTKRIIGVVRTLAFGFLLMVIALGVTGNQSPIRNIAPLALWVYLLLGFAYLSVFVKGVWERINPFAIGLPFFRHRSPRTVLPSWAAYLPALALYALLIWVELLSGGAGAVPKFVAFGLLGYWIGSWIVIDLYGKETWQKHFDVFGVFFSLMGTFAPLVIEDTGVKTRAPLADASHARIGLGLIALLIAVLAFTAFDGFRETRPYAEIMIPLSQIVPFPLLELVAFALFPVVFLGIYAVCIAGVKPFAGGIPYAELLKAYAFSLMPIAIVYHFAHYFPLLVAEGQRIVAMISDPFGYGWDLFGTAGYAVNPGLIGAEVLWYIQLAAIVAGHILALYLSHLITHRLVSERRRALLAELPLLAVMVFYTACGLWILSRPFAL